MWLLIYFQIYIAKINIWDETSRVLYINKIKQEIINNLRSRRIPQENINVVINEWFEIPISDKVVKLILNTNGIVVFNDDIHIFRKIEIIQYLFKNGFKGIINLLDHLTKEIISALKNGEITDLTTSFRFIGNFLNNPLLFSQLEKDAQLLKFTDEEINETTWEMVDKKKNNAAIKLQSAMRGYRVRNPSPESGGALVSSTDDIERFERVESIDDYNKDHYHKYYHFSLP